MVKNSVHPCAEVKMKPFR